MLYFWHPNIAVQMLAARMALQWGIRPVFGKDHSGDRKGMYFRRGDGLWGDQSRSSYGRWVRGQWGKDSRNGNLQWVRETSQRQD